jgi:hypothetical protein
MDLLADVASDDEEYEADDESHQKLLNRVAVITAQAAESLYGRRDDTFVDFLRGKLMTGLYNVERHNKWYYDHNGLKVCTATDIIDVIWESPERPGAAAAAETDRSAGPSRTAGPSSAGPSRAAGPSSAGPSRAAGPSSAGPSRAAGPSSAPRPGRRSRSPSQRRRHARSPGRRSRSPSQRRRHARSDDDDEGSVSVRMRITNAMRASHQCHTMRVTRGMGQTPAGSTDQDTQTSPTHSSVLLAAATAERVEAEGRALQAIQRASVFEAQLTRERDDRIRAEAQLADNEEDVDDRIVLAEQRRDVLERQLVSGDVRQFSIQELADAGAASSARTAEVSHEICARNSSGRLIEPPRPPLPPEAGEEDQCPLCAEGDIRANARHVASAAFGCNCAQWICDRCRGRIHICPYCRRNADGDVVVIDD